jgi:hypothetical protein
MNLENMLHLNILPNEIIDIAFDTIIDEIHLEPMDHKGGQVPRLINMQATIENECVPIYRHPIDAQLNTIPFTPMVAKIKYILETRFKCDFNHVVIQYYKDGYCYIGEHSDKTLDIKRESSIVNISLGASRQFILKHKETKEKTNIKLPNNSCYELAWAINQTYLHTIKQDKRNDSMKQSDEIGPRISLTFRQIATFIDKDGNLHGQGASKIERSSSQQLTELLHAFSNENKQTNFDWDKNYGDGFDIIDCKTR